MLAKYKYYSYLCSTIQKRGSQCAGGRLGRVAREK